ncbi:MAG: hypothetical protein K2O65_16630 [Lachnospiraceae bacterium]|nr:hypothetical protein [Lachnospiraceae bacterium]
MQGISGESPVSPAVAPDRDSGFTAWTPSGVKRKKQRAHNRLVSVIQRLCALCFFLLFFVLLKLKFSNKKQEVPAEYNGEQALQRAKIAEKYGFVDIKYALFYRTRTFLANEYSTLLGTYSDHIAIEENIRKEFFSKIEDAINNHGGSITVYDTIDLQLARKP